jgi:hypothetical protein
MAVEARDRLARQLLRLPLRSISNHSRGWRTSDVPQTVAYSPQQLSADPRTDFRFRLNPGKPAARAEVNAMVLLAWQSSHPVR